MIQAEIVVLGGSAAGRAAAVTARRHYPGKKVLMVRKEQKVSIPCGIPYILGTLGSPDKNLMPDAPLEKINIDILIAEATSIDKENKILCTENDQISYEKLIIATGSLPAMPPIPGIKLNGVYGITKDVDYLANLQEIVKDLKNIVVIGGGFIGIEFADELNKLGNKNITIVEILPNCLALAYDKEFCVEMEDHLKDRGVNILTSRRVKSIEGSDKAEKVVLDDGTELPVDVVILGIGAVPNAKLAKEAGLDLCNDGSICIDNTMRTSDKDIFSCGDCSVNASFFGGLPSKLKLASIASTEARIAGANLYHVRRETPGTIGCWSTCVGDLALATAGLTESMAISKDYDIVTGVLEGMNRHPGIMPGAARIKMKLVFEASTGIILGGQVLGDPTAGEMINCISACVQMKMTADDIAMFQIGTHPALTASPVAYPLVNAAEIAIGKLRKR